MNEKNSTWLKGTVPFLEITQYAESFGAVRDLEFRQFAAPAGLKGYGRYVSDGVALLYEERYPADIGSAGQCRRADNRVRDHRPARQVRSLAGRRMPACLDRLHHERKRG